MKLTGCFICTVLFFSWKDNNVDYFLQFFILLGNLCSVVKWLLYFIKNVQRLESQNKTNLLDPAHFFTQMPIEWTHILLQTWQNTCRTQVSWNFRALEAIAKIDSVLIIAITSKEFSQVKYSRYLLLYLGNMYNWSSH